MQSKGLTTNTFIEYLKQCIEEHPPRTEGNPPRIEGNPPQKYLHYDKKNQDYKVSQSKGNLSGLSNSYKRLNLREITLLGYAFKKELITDYKNAQCLAVALKQMNKHKTTNSQKLFFLLRLINSIYDIFVNTFSGYPLSSTSSLINRLIKELESVPKPADPTDTKKIDSGGANKPDEGKKDKKGKKSKKGKSKDKHLESTNETKKPPVEKKPKTHASSGSNSTPTSRDISPLLSSSDEEETFSTSDLEPLSSLSTDTTDDEFSPETNPGVVTSTLDYSTDNKMRVGSPKGDSSVFTSSPDATKLPLEESKPTSPRSQKKEKEGNTLTSTFRKLQEFIPGKKSKSGESTENTDTESESKAKSEEPAKKKPGLKQVVSHFSPAHRRKRSSSNLRLSQDSTAVKSSPPLGSKPTSSSAQNSPRSTPFTTTPDSPRSSRPDGSPQTRRQEHPDARTLPVEKYIDYAKCDDFTIMQIFMNILQVGNDQIPTCELKPTTLLNLLLTVSYPEQIIDLKENKLCQQVILDYIKYKKPHDQELLVNWLVLQDGFSPELLFKCLNTYNEKLIDEKLIDEKLINFEEVSIDALYKLLKHYQTHFADLKEGDKYVYPITNPTIVNIIASSIKKLPRDDRFTLLVEWLTSREEYNVETFGVWIKAYLDANKNIDDSYPARNALIGSYLIHPDWAAHFKGEEFAGLAQYIKNLVESESIGAYKKPK